MEFNELNRMTLKDLRQLAKEIQVPSPTTLAKAELIARIQQIQAEPEQGKAAASKKRPTSTRKSAADKSATKGRAAKGPGQDTPSAAQADSAEMEEPIKIILSVKKNAKEGAVAKRAHTKESAKAQAADTSTTTAAKGKDPKHSSDSSEAQPDTFEKALPLHPEQTKTEDLPLKKNNTPRVAFAEKSGDPLKASDSTAGHGLTPSDHSNINPTGIEKASLGTGSGAAAVAASPVLLTKKTAPSTKKGEDPDFNKADKDAPIQPTGSGHMAAASVRESRPTDSATNPGSRLASPSRGNSFKPNAEGSAEGTGPKAPFPGGLRVAEGGTTPRPTEGGPGAPASGTLAGNRFPGATSGAAPGRSAVPASRLTSTPASPYGGPSGQRSDTGEHRPVRPATAPARRVTPYSPSSSPANGFTPAAGPTTYRPQDREGTAGPSAPSPSGMGTQRLTPVPVNTPRSYSTPGPVRPLRPYAEPGSRGDGGRYTASNPGATDLLNGGECGECTGVLEIHPDGYGFLRQRGNAQQRDVYVSIAQIRRFNLRNGDLVVGKTRPEREGDRSQGLIYIDQINGLHPERASQRKPFEELTPIFPNRRLRLSGEDSDLAIRVMDLISPIGFGQRGMIVAPPKAGKTVLLKKLAQAISKNYPEALLYVLLIDERPEEVTDMQRSIQGEVIFSTFDQTPDHHCATAQWTVDRAQRLVEHGRDVIILMDSLTRYARASNLACTPSGRTLSGGLDPVALTRPKKFFGAARNTEEGGSLTILATALVETGSRMDEVIFEEFKGTGNMEAVLDRRLSEKRIFPAIDLSKSSTRREDLLLDERERHGVDALRRVLLTGNNDPTEQLIGMMERTRNNDEFLTRIQEWVKKWENSGYKMG